MKKRKVKLFASIASLAMVVAVMGVGVWAATNQSVTVSTTVAFSATAIDATVDLKVSGAASEATLTTAAPVVTAGTPGENGTDVLNNTIRIAAWEFDDNTVPVSNTVALTLQDADNDGYFGGNGDAVTYTFTITTSGEYSKVYYAIPTIEQDGWTITVNAASGEVTTSGTTVTVTFVKDDPVPKIAEETLDADITIYLENTLTKAQQEAGISNA